MKGMGSREASLARAPLKAASKTHTRDFAISPHSSRVTRHIAAVHMNGQCRGRPSGSRAISPPSMNGQYHGWPSALT